MTTVPAEAAEAKLSAAMATPAARVLVLILSCMFRASIAPQMGELEHSDNEAILRFASIFS